MLSISREWSVKVFFARKELSKDRHLYFTWHVCQTGFLTYNWTKKIFIWFYSIVQNMSYIVVYILYLSVVLCWYLAYKCQKLSFYVYFLCIFLLFPRKNSNTRMYDVLYQKYTYTFFGRMTSIWQPIKHKKMLRIFFSLSLSLQFCCYLD